MVFVGLEKKGTACGRSASERGDEPRSGTLSPPTLLMLPTPSSTIKKDRSLAVIFLWSWRLHKTPIQFIVFQCLQPLKNLSSNKRETKLYLYRLSGCGFQLSKTVQRYAFFLKFAFLVLVYYSILPSLVAVVSYWSISPLCTSPNAASNVSTRRFK